MSETRPSYAPEFRRQMVDLVRAGRDAQDLSRECEPSAQAIRNWVVEADFFCVEPVTHPVDAHDRPGCPAAHGMTIPSPGETSGVRCRFVPDGLVPARTGG